MNSENGRLKRVSERSKTVDLRPMRNAQIAPLIESVPPRLYGGTERIVSYLTEALVTQAMTSRCSPAGNP